MTSWSNSIIISDFGILIGTRIYRLFYPVYGMIFENWSNAPHHVSARFLLNIGDPGGGRLGGSGRAHPPPPDSLGAKGGEKKKMPHSPSPGFKTRSLLMASA